jgi:hypothetical protein
MVETPPLQKMGHIIHYKQSSGFGHQSWFIAFGHQTVRQGTTLTVTNNIMTASGTSTSWCEIK